MRNKAMGKEFYMDTRKWTEQGIKQRMEHAHEAEYRSMSFEKQEKTE